jgi:LPS O-antigen subunit length determinant protein (WzzB/FepE family)
MVKKDTPTNVNTNNNVNNNNVNVNVNVQQPKTTEPKKTSEPNWIIKAIVVAVIGAIVSAGAYYIKNGFGATKNNTNVIESKNKIQPDTK